MYQQMTIFDFLGTAYPDIKTITEAEAVRIVGDALGVEFTHNEVFNEWVARKGKTRLNLKYSNFNLPDNHDLFLGVGYDCRNPCEGGGSPCTSIEEAIKYLKSKIGGDKMRIDENSINHNAMCLIKAALDTYLIYADSKEQQPDAANVFIGQVAGIITMAKVLKEVLKT